MFIIKAPIPYPPRQFSRNFINLKIWNCYHSTFPAQFRDDRKKLRDFAKLLAILSASVNHPSSSLCDPA
jgi:hypothetical protein